METSETDITKYQTMAREIINLKYLSTPTHITLRFALGCHQSVQY
jgi:hypothetical protein